MELKISSYYAALRREQIKLLEQSIKWRQKNIKYLAKQNKHSQNSLSA